MTLSYNGTSSTTGGSTTSTPSSFNITESYNTVYSSSSTYKININFNAAGTAIQYTVWILKTGALVAVDLVTNNYSQNYTGAQAQEFGASVFSGFIVQIQADSQLNTYTASNYFHSAGTSSVSIGPTKMTVTNYVANTLPVTLNNCDGTTSTLTTYALSVGTPPGANAPLVTYEHFAGSTTETNGQVDTYNEIIQVTSITVA